MASKRKFNVVSNERRALLRGALLIAGGIATSPLVSAKPSDARKLPAQRGDELSFPSWENEGRPVLVTDIVLHAAPLLGLSARPRDRCHPRALALESNSRSAF